MILKIIEKKFYNITILIYNDDCYDSWLINNLIFPPIELIYFT